MRRWSTAVFAAIAVSLIAPPRPASAPGRPCQHYFSFQCSDLQCGRDEQVHPTTPCASAPIISFD
jgi:hypothetical protein